MDVTPYIAPLVTGILSIATVSAFVSRYVSKVIKYVRLAADAVNTLEYLTDALEDGMITNDELDNVKKCVEKFRADLKNP